MIDIKKLARDFTSNPGNSVVSEEMLINFYKFVESETDKDAYAHISEVCNLKETGTKGCYVMEGSLNYYIKTKFGFIDIRSEFQKDEEI